MRRPFDECWDRIERAKTHRDAGSAAWNAFVAEEDAYETSVEVDDNGTAGMWVEQVKPIPPVIAFEIGEFLYHLRAVLDGCVYEAACLNSGKRPPPGEEILEFVFRDSPAQFQEARWRIAPLTEQQRDIIESVQPYKAPKDLEDRLLPFNYHRGLAMLNDWARKDRHRKLHVVASWASNISPQVRHPKGTTILDFKIPTERFVLKHKSEIATFRIGGWQSGMKVYANPNLTFEMTVDEVPLPCHRNDHMNARLQCMVQAVAEIVGAIASTFPAELYE